jgi:hypothetical protein
MEVTIIGYHSIKVSFIGRGPVKIVTAICIITQWSFSQGSKTTLGVIANENVFVREWYRIMVDDARHKFKCLFLC